MKEINKDNIKSFIQKCKLDLDDFTYLDWKRILFVISPENQKIVNDTYQFYLSNKRLLESHIYFIRGIIFEHYNIDDTFLKNLIFTEKQVWFDYIDYKKCKIEIFADQIDSSFKSFSIDILIPVNYQNYKYSNNELQYLLFFTKAYNKWINNSFKNIGDKNKTILAAKESLNKQKLDVYTKGYLMDIWDYTPEFI